MNYEQSEEENQKAFVERLIEAGWSKEEAENEWLQIQSGEL